jgi:hypothetical protein
MYGVVSIVQLVLLFIIAISMIALMFPWAVKTVGESMDISEIDSIKAQFNDCGEKILETARTGTTNKCIFNIKRGTIKAGEEGVEYNLLSTAPICDQHNLVEIDERTHVWQACNVSGENRVYLLLWYFPLQLQVNGTNVQGEQMRGQSNIGNINFDNPINFRTLTLYASFEYIPGEAGNIVEISRVNITETNVTLKVKIS